MAAASPRKKNAFYAQSGGVTAVINASACGLIEAARQVEHGAIQQHGSYESVRPWIESVQCPGGCIYGSKMPAAWRCGIHVVEVTSEINNACVNEYTFNFGK